MISDTRLTSFCSVCWCVWSCLCLCAVFFVLLCLAVTSTRAQLRGYSCAVVFGRLFHLSPGPRGINRAEVLGCAHLLLDPAGCMTLVAPV